MNLIYKDNTLFIDLDKITRREISNLKYRVFNILNQYNIDNIIINSSSQISENHYLLNNFIEEYKQNYNGNIKIKKT